MKAKKSLGQNFLQDETVIDRIIEEAQLSSDDCVVEIGPGKGALTDALSKHAGKVIAFELDRDLIPSLLKKFPLSSNVTVLEKDILQADIVEVLRQYGVSGETSYKVIANIPYYITAPIIQHLLELSQSPKEIILMVQKEVAERITAKTGSMSILSVAVQYYADAKILFAVPKEAFDPIPQVDSAVISLKPKRSFDKEQDKQLFRVVKAGFSVRRKTLANNLSAVFHVSKEEVVQKLENVGLKANVRAQELSVDTWERLSAMF